jgi:hypothetical protein
LEPATGLSPPDQFVVADQAPLWPAVAPVQVQDDEQAIVNVFAELWPVFEDASDWNACAV